MSEGPGWTGGLPMRVRLRRAGLFWLLVGAVATGVYLVAFGPLDPRVVTLLGGPDGVATLSGPDRVEAWRIDGGPWPSGKPAGPALHGYPVLSGPVPVDADAAVRLVRVLRRADTYLFDAAKGCVFSPGVVVRFTRGERSVDVLLCFSCDELSVVPGGREDFDAARPELVTWVKRAFPADAALQALTPRR